MNAANIETLNAIFRIVFDLSGTDPVNSIRRINYPKWDSLAHVSLLAAIESEFNVRLDVKEMDRIGSYAAATVLLTEKGF